MRFTSRFFKTLTVTVRLEDRYFFVGGQVRMPGQKLYLSEMTVTKAIQAAGDFTDFANRGRLRSRARMGLERWSISERHFATPARSCRFIRET
jgi:protein involved in polysaccharide export with SLBB domain